MSSLADEVRAFAFSLPEAWEDHPWGDESVAKVGKKVFVFFGTEQPDDASFWLGVKLPQSTEDALVLPFAKPMGYGLDRGGWVGIQAPPDMPVEVLHTWIEESFRAVAPKSVIKLLDASKEREGTASASPDV